MGLSKIGELLINNSFSVQKAISYFLQLPVFQQELLFTLIVFYLRSCKCFFHGLCDSFLKSETHNEFLLKYNCHRLVNKLPVI